jgi:hypothetical protein
MNEPIYNPFDHAEQWEASGWTDLDSICFQMQDDAALNARLKKTRKWRHLDIDERVERLQFHHGKRSSRQSLPSP